MELTIGATELGDGVDEAIVELGSPTEARLGVAREEVAGVSREVGPLQGAMELLYPLGCVHS